MKWTLFLTLLLTGCSLLPYENEFACRKTDDLGKCISVEEAYKEAVTGQSQHPTIQAKKSKTKPSEPQAALSVDEAYTQYQAQVYREMATLIEAPRTPMLKPAKTLRTLILSYSPNADNKVFYMPRYVYSIIDDPGWVLGDYLNRTTETKLITPWE